MITEYDTLYCALFHSITLGSYFFPFRFFPKKSYKLLPLFCGAVARPVVSQYAIITCVSCRRIRHGFWDLEKAYILLLFYLTRTIRVLREIVRS